ncbi:MAG: tetratricopeptide repeat protein [Thermoplasmata archaeon]|nr:MAG: tetratricopeptide repeat protein [Thermoplasmata archaeon]
MEKKIAEKNMPNAGFVNALNRMGSDTFEELVNKLMGFLGLEIIAGNFVDDICDIKARVGDKVKDADFPLYLIRMYRRGNTVSPEDLQDFVGQGRDGDEGLMFFSTSSVSEDARLYAKEFDVEIVDNKALAAILKKSYLLHELLTYRDREILREEKGRYLPSIDELENIIESGNRAFAKRDYYDALSYFKKATDLKPNYDAAWYMKGLIFNNLKRYQEALEAFMKALESNIENEEAWYSLGLVLYSLGRYDEELECYDKAIELKKNFFSAWNNKGTTLLQLERYEEAIECYDEILRQNRNFKMALNNKGIALKKMKRTDEALECFTEAIKIDANYQDAWFNKGQILLDSKRYKEAYHCFERVLAFNPDNIQGLYGKGRSLEGVGQFSRAIECYGRIITIDARFYAAKRRKKKAQKSLEQKGDSPIDEDFFKIDLGMQDVFQIMPHIPEKERILVEKTVSIPEVSLKEVESKLEPTFVSEPEPKPDIKEVVSEEKKPLPERQALTAEAKALSDMRQKLEEKELELIQMEDWLKDKYETFKKERHERDASAENFVREREVLQSEREALKREKAKLIGQTKGVAKAKENISVIESALYEKEEELTKRYEEIEKNNEKILQREKELETAALKLKKRQEDLEMQAKILMDKERSLREDARIHMEVGTEEKQVFDFVSEVEEPGEKEQMAEEEPEEIEMDVEIEGVEEEVEPKVKGIEPEPQVVAEEGIRELFIEGETVLDREVLALYSLRRFDEVDERITQSFQQGFESKLLWILKGNILREKRQLDEASSCYENALKLDQNYIITLVNLMSINYERGGYEEAYNWCKKILAHRPKDEKFLLEKALLEAKFGQIDEAISTIDSILEINNKLEGVWNLKGMIMYNLNRDDEAMACFDRVLHINSTNYTALNNKGVLLYHGKKLDEAVECFDSALEIAPNKRILENKDAILKELDQMKEEEEVGEEHAEPGIISTLLGEIAKPEQIGEGDVTQDLEIEESKAVGDDEGDMLDLGREGAKEAESSLFMCPSCGAFVSETATKCNSCGYDFESEETELIEEVEEVEEEEEFEEQKEDKEISEGRPKDEIIKDLMNISGIGLSKANALYEAGFRSIDDLREAPVTDLAEVKGIGRTLAKIIKKRLESKKFKEGE